MSEQERRKGYYDARVLIESARILAPQFLDSILRISGAQLEMLRNLMQYLHRRSTFVGEYHDRYYLTPTDGDWDNLQAIVADLEEVLMGNENVIFGYSDRYAVEQWDTSNVNGPYACNLPGPPNGEIWRVSGVACYRNSVAGETARFVLIIPARQVNMGDVDMPEINRAYNLHVGCTLKHGDNITVAYQGCANGEGLITFALGFKMKVP